MRNESEGNKDPCTEQCHIVHIRVWFPSLDHLKSYVRPSCTECSAFFFLPFEWRNAL